MSKYSQIRQQVSSLLLYQSVFATGVGNSFRQFLEDLTGIDRGKTASIDAISAYGNWFKALAETNCSWQDYLVDRLLLDDNPFSRQLQTRSLVELPSALVAAAQSDLEIVQSIYNLTMAEIVSWLPNLSGSIAPPIIWDLPNRSPAFLHQERYWHDSIETLADYYRSRGTGIYAEYRAFRWQGKLVGIKNPDSIDPEAIVGYDYPRAALLKNTEMLLAGYNALHILLYGSRGSGKSSLVKSLLSQYGDRGLRLIEVAKSNLTDLPDIVDLLRDLPQKFIIFVDDLSFEEDDEAFKSLKVVLEGSLTAKAQNVVVYATSNRRHLVREYFVDRPRPSDADEVHSWDTVQEKLSFSDRFGLTLTFEPANQDTYLTIVRHLADRSGIKLAPEDLEFRAKQWATRHNGRSGRTAKQFVDFLQGELAISETESDS